jgi:hypothetical protein
LWAWSLFWSLCPPDWGALRNGLWQLKICIPGGAASHGIDDQTYWWVFSVIKQDYFMVQTICMVGLARLLNSQLVFSYFQYMLCTFSSHHFYQKYVCLPTADNPVSPKIHENCKGNLTILRRIL